MPHSTYKYRFEFKILDWCGKFSRLLAGDNRGFLILFNSEGVVKSILTGNKPEHFELDLRDFITEENPHWFFYDPFDAPEYIYIAWKNIQVNALERIVGQSFEPSDLLFVEARKGDNIENIPESWKVVF